MRWLTANRAHICSACHDPIQPGAMYFGNSYSSFCRVCGEKKSSGQLLYRYEDKKYVDIEQKKCKHCGK